MQSELKVFKWLVGFNSLENHNTYITSILTVAENSPVGRPPNVRFTCQVFLSASVSE